MFQRTVFKRSINHLSEFLKFFIQRHETEMLATVQYSKKRKLLLHFMLERKQNVLGVMWYL